MKTKYNRVFFDVGHECEMVAEEDEIEHAIRGNSMYVRLRRRIMRMILVNEKICKRLALHLRSHGAIELERKRQLLYYPTSIHPYSTMRMLWDLYMSIVCFLQLILIPLDVAFYHFTNTFAVFSGTSFIMLRMALDLVFCVDLVVNAITGFYDESQKEIVLGHGAIFAHYMKGRFTFDLLASLPTHWDLFFDLDTPESILKILQTVSMIKYARFYHLNMYTKRLCVIFNVDFYLRHAILMVTWMLLYWHILSSTHVFAYFALTTNYDTDMQMFINASAFDAITSSLYDGALIINTATYGEKHPSNNYEYMTMNVLWFISKLVQIILLARTIEYLSAKTSPKLKYTEMVQQLTEFMRHKQLPLHTQKRILSYYEFHFQKTYFNENEIYATIAGQLRQEIVMQTCRQLVENVEFFKDLPLNLLVRIVSCMVSEVYLINDLVVKVDTVGNCMYFISSGTVAVYTAFGKEICHLEDGAHFGEIALVNKDQTRIASVLAVERCELYRLDRKDFVRAIMPYPDLLDKIQKIAADRQEKTAMVDAHTRPSKGQ